MEIKFNIIDDSNINLLFDFVKQIKSNHFRYFKSNCCEFIRDRIKNHVITVILTANSSSQIIGYAHLDQDFKIWFGIYILENYQSQGYGNKLINYMIEYCKHHQIDEIYLSVDKDNEKAIKMYKRHNFKDVSEDKGVILMNKNMT